MAKAPNGKIPLLKKIIRSMRRPQGKIRLLALLLCIVCSWLLCANLFKIQIVEGEKYQTMAITQQLKDIVIAPHRGSIYDRYMKTLAKSATVWNVIFEPGNLSSDDETAAAQVDLLAYGRKKVDGKMTTVTSLAEILDIEPETVVEKAKKVNSYYEVLKKKIDKEKYNEVTEFIKTHKIKCISLVETTKRYYPYNNLASTVLGFVNDMNQGAYGIESY